MPRVLLCTHPYNRNPAWYIPVGALYVESALRKSNIDVDFLDIDGLRLKKEEVLEHIQSGDYDIIGISALTTLFNYSKWLSEQVKKIKPSIKIVLGGILASSNYEYVLKNTFVDVCVLGDGEVTAVELVKTIRGGGNLGKVEDIAFKDTNGNVVTTGQRTPLKSFDDYPIHYGLINMRKYIRPGTIISSRGCTNNCNFCYSAVPGLRSRNAESVYEDIKLLVKDYKINYFTFLDSYLMASENFIITLCGLMKKLNIRWDCYGRIDRAKPSILKMMKESGCIRINYGIESFDQNILNLMNKRITVGKIRDGLENTFSAGLKEVCASFIVGYFGQTKESLLETINEARKWKLYANGFYFTPFPGTVDYQKAFSGGYLKDEDSYIRNHLGRGDEFDSIADKMYINFSSMSDSELLNGYKLFQQVLYRDNGIFGKIKTVARNLRDKLKS